MVIIQHLPSCCKILFDYLDVCSNGFFMFGILVKFSTNKFSSAPLDLNAFACMHST